MISRRLLRIKVAKTIYGHLQTPDRTLAQSEKELLHSIKKFNDLYHLFLSLIVEVADYSQSRMDIGKQKHIPTAAEKDPNTRFVNNAVVDMLRNNEALGVYIHSNKLSWVNYPEMVKKFFVNMSTKEYFQNYLNSDTCDFKADKQLVVNFLTNEVEDFDDLYSCLEEQSIFWMDEIEFVLGMVIKTVKGFKEEKGGKCELMPLYKESEDEDFATRLLRRAVIKRSEYLDLIGLHSSNWDVERIAFMDTVIMLTAISEIAEFPNIPIKVSFNEYIDLAKLFSTPNSASFINGVLDKIINQMKNENKIVKSGKGLVGEDAV
ncbi:transcription antitermination protein NusB [Williamwhitmania taraxaci]|uniref:NusB antitermination factor n=1 Tax=Williamwhitmania taraxaci TaxID=1640674 RepID=A0A1G6R5W0_9BACT|nr:transcription antitermination protein NusB [Williamwhitmania taraxaci]SDD00022.1 NusB antitermination factor [Williamwhitmania taraxaci]